MISPHFIRLIQSPVHCGVTLLDDTSTPVCFDSLLSALSKYQNLGENRIHCFKLISPNPNIVHIQSISSLKIHTHMYIHTDTDIQICVCVHVCVCSDEFSCNENRNVQIQVTFEGRADKARCLIEYCYTWQVME